MLKSVLSFSAMLTDSEMSVVPTMRFCELGDNASQKNLTDFLDAVGVVGSSSPTETSLVQT